MPLHAARSSLAGTLQDVAPRGFTKTFRKSRGHQLNCVAIVVCISAPDGFGTIFASLLTPAEYFRRVPTSVSQMGDVLQFIRKSDRDRIRLIREARAIYESIFPTETADIAPTGTVSIAPIGDDDTSP